MPPMERPGPTPPAPPSAAHQAARDRRRFKGIKASSRDARSIMEEGSILDLPRPRPRPFQSPADLPAVQILIFFRWGLVFRPLRPPFPQEAGPWPGTRFATNRQDWILSAAPSAAIQSFP